MQGMGLTTGGGFTTSTNIIVLPWASANSDFTVSPNGRWAVAIGISDPKMSIAEIQRDGSLQLHQQFTFPSGRIRNPHQVRFTKDSHHLILLSDGPDDLISYGLNKSSWRWEEIDYTTAPHDPPWTAPFRFAITPDDKYIVVVENSPGPLPDGYYRTLRVVRFGEDGTFTILPDKFLTLKGLLGSLTFVPPWSESYPNAPNGVMVR